MPIGKPYTTKVPVWRQQEEEPIHDPQQGDEAGKKVHILGFDPRAYFVAYQLAGSKNLDPIRLLIHQKIIWNNWEREGRRIMMLDGPRARVRNHAQAEWTGKGYNPANQEHIEQLVVTVPCEQTKEAIKNIVHRIDDKTTICLIQDGMGVVEELNNSFFEDPTKRPTYILGHMTTSIGYYKPLFFATDLRKPGKLYLTALERGVDAVLPSYFKFYPPVERRSNATTFLRTLVSTEGLGAGGYGLENFLVKKLPAMVFNSIVEPMAIALDTTYDQVLQNEHAILLADDLLRELFNVIWALPELINSEKVVTNCGMDALRKHTLKRLAAKGRSHSPYLSRVRAGRMVDIDYLNGYFVKRGKELGIKMPQNEMIIELVKSRVEWRQKQLRGLVPFEGLATNVPMDTEGV